MPTPINPVNFGGGDTQPFKSNPSYTVDYSMLANQFEDAYTKPGASKKVVTASNRDASLLYELWSKAEKSDEESFKVESLELNSRDIMRLKSMGFVTGNTNEVKLTDKGKKIITTISLAEPNRFQLTSQKKSYNEILASMDKRGKPGYRAAQATTNPKFASNNSNNIRL
jgi:hypothetical protein